MWIIALLDRRRTHDETLALWTLFFDDMESSNVLIFGMQTPVCSPVQIISPPLLDICHLDPAQKYLLAVQKILTDESLDWHHNHTMKSYHKGNVGTWPLRHDATRFWRQTWWRRWSLNQLLYLVWFSGHISATNGGLNHALIFGEGITHRYDISYQRLKLSPSRTLFRALKT